MFDIAATNHDCNLCFTPVCSVLNATVEPASVSLEVDWEGRMEARRIQVIRPTTYDFGELEVGGEQSVVVRRSIPSELPRGRLMVRVHTASVGSGDGEITVAVRADGFTPNDPSQLFFGPTLGSVAISENTVVPDYQVESFAVPSDYVMVQVSAAQDSSSKLSLNARVSVDLVLDDGPVESSWTPSELSPLGWWRADLGHTATQGQAVTSWANQGTAGSDGDLGQGTSTYQPIYDSSHASFNDQAVLDFDGTDVLYAAAGTWWEQTADGESMTVIAIARVTTADTTQNTLIQSYQPHANGGFQFTLRTDGGNSRWYVYQSGGGVDINDLFPGATQNAVHVVAGVLMGAISPSNDTSNVYLDGALADSESNDLGAIAASSPQEVAAGGAHATNGKLTGQIAELIYLLRQLTATEDAALTEYLNSRYGLSLTGVTQ